MEGRFATIIAGSLVSAYLNHWMENIRETCKDKCIPWDQACADFEKESTKTGISTDSIKSKETSSFIRMQFYFSNAHVYRNAPIPFTKVQLKVSLGETLEAVRRCCLILHFVLNGNFNSVTLFYLWGKSCWPNCKESDNFRLDTWQSLTKSESWGGLNLLSLRDSETWWNSPWIQTNEIIDIGG